MGAAVTARPRRRAVFAAVAVASMFAASAPGAANAETIRTLPFGSSFVVHGQTGSVEGSTRRAVGRIIVRGSWNGGESHVISTTRTDAYGKYRFSIHARRRGLLRLQIVPPDKHVQLFTLRII